ncbi:YSIRK-type signal peptide-containing protein [Streptococcus loxodontisalivarius]|uniref:LPXTG-motif cell wall-anchored protein n=1 Tax=Streptococcus loxodontisalivarius TaxID=1349415 RepID=A0ABS2PTP2_9STRE|nr:YSIRK-type signal peptide-containing protein [Streptococcus loxodontisalivarius]MBM7643404.1 LPXTG-motif cell wall-anchored protein [Streptococcus loxodontisalivarius]
MISFKEKQRRFSLRKLSVGLASVAVAFLFMGGHASADETTSTPGTAPADSSSLVTSDVASSDVLTDMTVTSENLIDGKTATEVAVEEIQTSLAQPIVPANTAQVGDVIDVQAQASEPTVTESETDNVAKASGQVSVTVKTTSIADPSAEVGTSPSQVETMESSVTYEGDKGTVSEYERVVKTSTVEIVSDADQIVETQLGTVDMVFVIDHSSSMAPKITAVKNSITNFVSTLNTQKLDVRLGLADYEDAVSVNYYDFSGSKFTKDTNAFIQALDQIVIKGGFEEGTVPLTYIADSANYDWSTGANNRRFAIVVTDEDFDFFNKNTPSLESTIQALKAANISTTVVASKSDFKAFEQLTQETNGKLIDVQTEFENGLSSDVASWVVKTVKEGRRYKVLTEQYDVFVEVIAVWNEEAETPVKPEELVQTAVTFKKTEPTISQSQEPECLPVQTKVKQEVAVQKAEVLPETGNQDSALLSLFGFASLLAAAAYKKKKD